MIEICLRYRIDVLFPTNDVEARHIARHSDQFEQFGVTVVVPQVDRLERAQDKYQVAVAAQRIGFPCPRTFLYESHIQAADAAQQLGFPLVVKATDSRGSIGVRFVQSPRDLSAHIDDLLLTKHRLILQEYIPGGRERSLNFVIDQQGQVLHAFALRKMHYLRPSLSTAVEVVHPPPEMEAAVELLRALRLWGVCVLQTKIDERDGRYKLIELNARFGNNARILFRFGADLPLALIAVARNESPTLCPFRPGTIGVSPFEDVIAALVFVYRRLKLDIGRHQKDCPALLPGWLEMTHSYLWVYRHAVVDDYTKGIAKDPFGTFSYYGRTLRNSFRFQKHWEYFMPWQDIR
ncbi:MAG TPA: ATP-grasp domain-containing protein [Vicinamibacterales bacterium]|nr:ATP-grasp domain-containing protein [Vicinamibacterales bacterium]